MNEEEKTKNKNKKKNNNKQKNKKQKKTTKNNNNNKKQKKDKKTNKKTTTTTNKQKTTTTKQNKTTTTKKKTKKTKKKTEAHGPQWLTWVNIYKSLIQLLNISVAMATNQNEEFAQKFHTWGRTTLQLFLNGYIQIPVLRLQLKPMFIFLHF